MAHQDPVDDEPSPAPGDARQDPTSRHRVALDHLRRGALEGAGPPSSRVWSAVLDSLDRRSRRVLGAAAAVVVVVVVVLVAVWWARPASRSPDAPLREAHSLATIPMASPSTTAEPDVVVHAAGAVANPGVYRLGPGARVGDLVEVAGGLATDADADRLNLASELVDGSRVYVPRRGEAAVPPLAGGPLDPGQQSSGTGHEGGGEGAGSPVDVNVASAEVLEGLPGIGPATASAIVEHRQRRGPFRAVDDLLDVPGIGPAKLERLRPLVRV